MAIPTAPSVTATQGLGRAIVLGYTAVEEADPAEEDVPPPTPGFRYESREYVVSDPTAGFTYVSRGVSEIDPPQAGFTYVSRYTAPAPTAGFTYRSE